MVRYILGGRKAQKVALYRSLMLFEVYGLGLYAPTDTLMECSLSGNVVKTFRGWFDEWGFPDPLKDFM